MCQWLPTASQCDNARVALVSYGKCYYFKSLASSDEYERSPRWRTARNLCVKDGGDLITFNKISWAKATKYVDDFIQEFERREPKQLEPSEYPLGLRRVILNWTGN